MKRRDFLTRAPVAVAVIAVPAAAMPPTTPIEHSAVLALGDELAPIERAYHEAVATWCRMWATWAPQWPLAPECCTRPHATPSDYERGLSGRALTQPGQSYPFRVLSRRDLEQSADWAREGLAKDAKRKRSWGKGYVQGWKANLASAELGLALLPGYLAECGRIKNASDYEAINNARTQAAEAFIAHVFRVVAEPSRTLAGARVKALAAEALGRLDGFDGMHLMSANLKAPRPLATMLGDALLQAIDA